MKPLPARQVPGKKGYERFDNAVRQVLTASKDELFTRGQREQKSEAKRPKKA